MEKHERQYPTKCTGCEWKGVRVMAKMHHPCPACGGVVNRMGGRAYGEGATTAKAPFKGMKITIHVDREGRRSFRLRHPKTGERLFMSELRYVAAVKLKRRLERHEFAGALDGNHLNVKPSNVIVGTLSEVRRAQLEFKDPNRFTPGECTMCGGPVPRTSKPSRQRETCSKECHVQLCSMALSDVYAEKRAAKKAETEKLH